MLFLLEYLGTALRASYLYRRISVLHRDLEALHFSRLEGSGKKQVIANSMHRKDYPYSLLTEGLAHYQASPSVFTLVLNADYMDSLFDASN